MASVSKIKAHPTKPEDTPVFAVVSYALEDAPDACGFSDKMLREAITAGALIAHRAVNWFVIRGINDGYRSKLDSLLSKGIDNNSGNSNRFLSVNC